MNCRRALCAVALATIGLVSWGCAQSTSQAEVPQTAGGAIHDATITASVKLALAFKPGVSSMHINVDTDHGVVTLRGQVETESERQLAAKVAEDVGNVNEVVNDLTVR